MGKRKPLAGGRSWLGRIGAGRPGWGRALKAGSLVRKWEGGSHRPGVGGGRFSGDPEAGARLLNKSFYYFFGVQEQCHFEYIIMTIFLCFLYFIYHLSKYQILEII